MNTRIVIFAKAPRPGLVKTRLIPALGADGAAALADYLLHSTLEEARHSQADSVELCTEPAFDDPAWQGVSFPENISLSYQGAGDLGERMARVVQRVVSQGERVILIGTDCPGLTRQKLNEAIAALQTQRAVMFEALDGGYTLLGLQAFDPALFAQIAWSTDKVSEQTHLAFSRLGWQCKVLGRLADIDRPEDLRGLPSTWWPAVELLINEWQTMSEPQTQKPAAEASRINARDTVDLNQRLGNLRPRLLAFARLQLSDRDMAEDVTQEAITAAWQGLAEFRGESQFETWVFGILRFKILDEIRRKKSIKSISLDEASLADIDGFFKTSESWDKASAPASWSEPDQALEQDQFWQVFDICVFHLPENTARVYSLREMIGLDTQEICDLLQISEQNCWVILHRARLKLRACLENGWFLKTR